MTRRDLLCRFLGHAWRRDGAVTYGVWWFFDACTRCGKVRPVTP